jgi:DNA-binding Lrp family transcriptional regulator
MRESLPILRIDALLSGNFYAFTASLRQTARKTCMNLDETDTRLLAALQKNAHLTAQELGEQLHLSASQAGRRRQRLEADGYIQGYTARLDPVKLGLNVQGFVQVHLDTHGPQNSATFGRLLATRPEIVSAWTMTGDADYLLRVYCEDLPSLNRLIHEVLLPHPAVSRVHSQIVMDQLKRDGPLPT